MKSSPMVVALCTLCLLVTAEQTRAAQPVIFSGGIVNGASYDLFFLI